MYLHNWEFLPWLDIWMAKHKKRIMGFGAVLCGIGSFILTNSPNVFNIYVTVALIHHYLAPKEPPSIVCGMAYNIATILLCLSNVVEDLMRIPHFLDFAAEQIGLTVASVLMLVGLKFCELCGNWNTEPELVKRLDLCVVGVCLYGVAMGILPPAAVGSSWRYVAGGLVAVLVFCGGEWLHDEEGRRWGDVRARVGSGEKEEKGGEGVEEKKQEGQVQKK